MLSSCSGGRSSTADKSYGSKRSSSNSVLHVHHESQLELLESSSSDILDTAGDTSANTSGNSSDHSCRSLLNDQQLRKLIITDRNNNNLPAGPFINADGSIFALASNDQAVIQQQPSFAPSIMLEQRSHQDRSSPPPLPRGNHCDQTTQEYQHRRLQYQPIHQQLQRIYGNKLQELEHQKQTKLQNRKQPSLPVQQAKQSAAMVKSQPPPAAPHQQQQQKQQQYQQAHSASHQHQQHHQQQQQHNNHALNNHLVNQQQFHQQKPVMYHHHHDHHNHNHQEQAYDSLSSPPAPPLFPPIDQVRQHHHHQQQQQQQQRKLHQHFIHHHQPICVIPEEDCDMNNNQVLRHSQEGQQLVHLDEEDDEDAAEDEGGLIGPARSDVANLARSSRLPVTSKSYVLVENRKKHLESLHYATATAAALLNVTASAAAAFAASEKSLNQQGNKQQALQRQNPVTIKQIRTPPKQRHQAQIYSETYQDINTNQQHYQTQQQYQHVKQSRYHGTRLIDAYQMPAQHQPDRPKPPSSIQPANLVKRQQPRSMSFRYQQQQQQQHHQNQQQHTHENYQQQLPFYQLRSQPQSKMQLPEPDFRKQLPRRQPQLLRQDQMLPLMTTESEILRQQRQLREQQKNQLAPTNVLANTQQSLSEALALRPVGAGCAPTFGVLHQNGKPTAGLDIDLLAKLASQKQLQHKSKQKHYVQYAANLDPRFLAAQNMFAQVAATGKIPDALKSSKQQMTYGLLVAHPNRQSINQKHQQVYGGAVGHGGPALLQAQPHVILPHLASGASSEASGHTNLSLILDRRLRPVGLVEKICQIDLTLFWWSLLTICIIFIATLVTITRYVF